MLHEGCMSVPKQTEDKPKLLFFVICHSCIVLMVIAILPFGLQR